MILAFLLVFHIIKEPCDAVTSRAQIDPFYPKEPTMALYQRTKSRLVSVVSESGFVRQKRVADFFCSFCEKTVEKRLSNAKRDHSCGCARGKLIATHGMAETPTYNSWKCMLARCGNEKNTQFCDYGGRGIKVCDAWKSFGLFLSDMGVRPDGTTLDRIDANGDYEPCNCRWATSRQQSTNKRSSRFLTIDGETKTVSEWAEHEKAVSEATIRARVRLGWLHKDAVFKLSTRRNAFNG
jgi:hypothetical protein